MTDKLPPIHPGEILREDFMLPLGLSSNALARAIGVTPARINEIVREKRGITAETAGALARAGADFVAVSAAVWRHPEGPAAGVRALNAALAEASDAG